MRSRAPCLPSRPSQRPHGPRDSLLHLPRLERVERGRRAAHEEITRLRRAAVGGRRDDACDPRLRRTELAAVVRLSKKGANRSETGGRTVCGGRDICDCVGTRARECRFRKRLHRLCWDNRPFSLKPHPACSYALWHGLLFTACYLPARGISLVKEICLW